MDCINLRYCALMAAFAVPTLSVAAPKAASPAAVVSCAPVVKSQAEALAKANWIIEATIADGVNFDNSKEITLTLEDIKTVKSAWEPRKIYTGIATLEPCFGELRGKAVAGGTFNGYGKKFRIFGTKRQGHAEMRAFYFEPASAKFDVPLSALVSSTADVQRPVKPYVAPPIPKMHRFNASNLQSDGWHRARSTDGKFSIDIPVTFHDGTVESSRTIAHIIRSANNGPIKYFAGLEPVGAPEEMTRTFDGELVEKGVKVVTFKGVRATVKRNTQGTDVTHTMMFRTTAGTYLLGVSAPKETEHEVLGSKDRFFNSFTFE